MTRRLRRRLEFRVRPTDVERWETIASREDMTLSEWIRRTCNQAVRTEYVQAQVSSLVHGDPID